MTRNTTTTPTTNHADARPGRANPTTTPTPPAWPYPDITHAEAGGRLMRAHHTGQWAMTFQKRTYYFGVWRDPAAALANWRRRWPRIIAGEDDTLPTAGSTLLDLLNAWLDRKAARLETDERDPDRKKVARLKPATFRDYRRSARWIVATLGGDLPLNHLTTAHWVALLDSISHLALTTQDKRITHALAVRKFADDYLDIRLPKPPPEFHVASRRLHRAERRKKAAEPLDPGDIRAMLDLASPRMRAILLTMFNGGYRVADLAQVPLSALDRSAPKIQYPRPKTEAWQLVPLWPETLAAIDAAEADRSLRAAGSPLLFTARTGRPLSYQLDKTTCDNVRGPFARLAEKAGVKASPADFRYTFDTIAAETADDTSRKIIVGHVIEGMDALYIRRWSLDRLRVVTDHVRSWLFGAP